MTTKEHIKQTVILDCECFTNYFLASFKLYDSDKIVHFELYPGQELDIDKLSKTLRAYTIVTFNGKNYDLPIIGAALQGASNKELKKISDKLILDKRPAWMICRDDNIPVPDCDHIDLFDVAPGRSSLKIYGGRLHAPHLESLPINPSALINSMQREQLRLYCVNDLETTELLYNELQPQIELRKVLGKQYGMELRSSGDAQIAEKVLMSEIKKLTERQYKAPNYELSTFRYKAPSFIEFRSPFLKSVVKRLGETEFELAGNGSIKCPAWIKQLPVSIGDKDYQLGVGGLHSLEKKQFLRSSDTHQLINLDVASYYPNIILNLNISPGHIGASFNEVYQTLVTRRLNAKHSGDKTTADTLKIVLNSSFGKMGNKYSALYSPELLLRITLTGQLGLLMLIEQMERKGIECVSANTDGVVLRCFVTDDDIVDEVATAWQTATSFVLERDDYEVLASRDVNTYVAIREDGSTYGKGAFAKSSLAKNPDFRIIYDAAVARIATGRSIKSYIKDCTDIRKFLKLRKVTGGAKWCDEELGNTVRFYYSTKANADEPIRYVVNGNKVPESDGAIPLMNLGAPGDFPNDVDYDKYVDMTWKLLDSVGFE